MPSPEASMLSDQLRSMKPGPEVPPRPLAELRAAADMLGSMIPAPDDVEVTPLDGGGVPCDQLTSPGVASDAVLLYFHGGGFVSGSAAGYRSFPARLAAAAGIRSVSVDYRLAPEHPYPAAVDDCVTAYGHLLDCGVAAERIAFAGDSAGGFLVIATMLEAQRRGLSLPACGVALSPWFDLGLSGPTVTSKADEDPIGRRADLLACTEMLLPAGVDPATTGPLSADLSGLPPVLVHVGTSEILLDDARRFEEAARRAGADVTVHAWEGLFHIFPFFTMLPEATEATDEAARFVGKHLGAV